MKHILVEGKPYSIDHKLTDGRIILRPESSMDRRKRKCEWAQSVLSKINTNFILFAMEDNHTYALNKLTGRFGTATRMPSDEEITMVGKAVALCKVMGWAIPDYI